MATHCGLDSNQKQVPPFEAWISFLVTTEIWKQHCCTMLMGIFEQTKSTMTTQYSLELIQDGSTHTLNSASLTLELSSSKVGSPLPRAV